VYKRQQIFTGDVAVANGYIDQFGTLEDAVKWVLAQATVRKVNEMYNI
jgi:ClpP class serine protease